MSERRDRIERLMLHWLPDWNDEGTHALQESIIEIAFEKAQAVVDAVDRALAPKCCNAAGSVEGCTGPTEAHACPYAQELNDSTDEEYCTCCEACTRACAEEI